MAENEKSEDLSSNNEEGSQSSDDDSILSQSKVTSKSH